MQAGSHGGGEANRALGDFYGEMDAVIQRDPFATPADREAALDHAAAAAFDRIVARAKK